MGASPDPKSRDPFWHIHCTQMTISGPLGLLFLDLHNFIPAPWFNFGMGEIFASNTKSWKPRKITSTPTFMEYYFNVIPFQHHLPLKNWPMQGIWMKPETCCIQMIPCLEWWMSDSLSNSVMSLTSFILFCAMISARTVHYCGMCKEDIQLWITMLCKTQVVICLFL